MAYIVKVKKISVVNETGDRVVLVNCYLSDSYGTVFKSVDGSIGFDIRAPKSSLPSSAYGTYLTNLAKDQISKKYSRYLTVSTTPTHGSDRLLFASTDTAKLFIGLTVMGPGITSSTTLTSITSATEIKLSSTLVLQVTGNTTAASFTKTGTTTLNSTTISNMSDITNISAGMSISGLGIPYGTTVLSLLSTTSISITQQATSTNTGATYTFNTDPNSIYLNITSPASYFSTIYEGLAITGTNIPRNTTIATEISTTKVQLSNNTTGTVTGATYTIAGSPVYYFDASNLTLNTTEVANVANIINFPNL